MNLVKLSFMAILSFLCFHSIAFTLTISSTNESCFPGNDGSISVGTIGGSPPFAYTWSRALPSTPNLANLSAGTYLLTVTDAVASTQTASIIINSSIGPTLATTAVDPSCNGANDGSITVNTNAGRPPFTYLWSTNSVSPSISNLTAGTYTVSVLDLNGCNSVSTVTLNDPPLIVNTVSQNGLLLTADQANASYQWEDCVTNIAIVGATNQSFLAPLNGYYAVEITVNRCTDRSSCISTFTIGVEENKASNAVFSIYPNPTKGFINFELTKEMIGQNLRILNINGQVVFESILTESQTTLDLSHLEKGIYFVNFNMQMKKLVLTN